MIDFTGKTDKQITDIVIKDHTGMENERRDFEGLWEIETQIFSPRRYDLLRTGRKKGQQYGTRIYDVHPSTAANKYALGMLAHQMSRSMPWIQFITSDVRLMKDDNVKKYVQGAAEQVLFGLNESDIYGQSVWFSKDATVIGTGVSIPVENKKAGKMHYETVHPRDSYVKYDNWGNLIVYHRPVKISAIEALDKFGKDNLPRNLIRDAEGVGQGNPFKDYNFLYATYRNPSPKPGSVLSTDKAWKVFYILKASSRRNKLVFKGGTQFESNIWTYGREPGTNYGVSLAADALTGGLQANKLGELMLTMVHREADPPTEAPKFLRTKGIQTNPGGRNWVPEKYVGHNAIREIFTSGNWPISDAERDRLGAAIDDIFFVPLWDALLTLQGPQRTLGEVLQIQGNKAILLSPVSESFEEQYLTSVVNAQWIFEEKIRRKMPDVPDILLEPANRKIQTMFIGPLPQLQRATMQTRGTINALGIIEQIGGIWSSALVKINEMELMEEAAIAQGMKQTLIRSEDEVKEILDAQAEAATADRQAELAIEGAKTVPGLGKTIEQNSPLELVGAGV